MRGYDDSDDTRAECPDCGTLYDTADSDDGACTTCHPLPERIPTSPLGVETMSDVVDGRLR